MRRGLIHVGVEPNSGHFDFSSFWLTGLVSADTSCLLVQVGVWIWVGDRAFCPVKIILSFCVWFISV